MIDKTKILDRVRGCAIGGAVGDALGYAVEFKSEKQIFDIYGNNGITSFELDLNTGKALISDDTQMSLFTADGLLIGETRGKMRGIMGMPHRFVSYCYKDWLLTQIYSYDEIKKHERYTELGGRSWLLDVPELFSLRAPGNTCLSALQSKKTAYIGHPLNNSKGCGGVMRVAPLGLKYRINDNYTGDIETLDMEGAEIAAITHGHSLGYMPAAVLTHIISKAVVNYPEQSLKMIIEEAKETVKTLFRSDEHLKTLVRIIDLAIDLSENDKPDIKNIHSIGEGWVAEETLAIAIYCSLKYEHNFSKAIITAVNHNGDSDSTGAVTGNIVGLLTGYDAIPEKWKCNLELSDIIIEMADDLYYGCKMTEYGSYRDPVWVSKYINMHRFFSKKD